MMALCLLLPLAFLLFGGGASGVEKNWGWFALIGAFILIHVFMMFGHGQSQDKEDETDKLVSKSEVRDSQNH